MLYRICLINVHSSNLVIASDTVYTQHAERSYDYELAFKLWLHAKGTRDFMRGEGGEGIKIFQYLSLITDVSRLFTLLNKGKGRKGGKGG